MKLYHFKNARSTRVRWLLEELGVAHEIVPVDLAAGEQRSPDHLKRHPHGAIPVLVVGTSTLIESAAIVLHLADTHHEKKLAPRVGSAERAKYYQFILYAAATVDPALATIFAHGVKLPPEKRSAELLRDATERFDTAARFLSGALAGGQFLLESEFSAADVTIGWDIAFAHSLKLLDAHPALRSYFERLSARPAFQRAYA